MGRHLETSYRRCYACAHRLKPPCFNCEDGTACKRGHYMWLREKEKLDKRMAIREAIYGKQQTERN